MAEVILLCAQAELPLHGHESKSSNPGNIMMILKMVANHDVVVKRYLETSPGNAKYTSPTIQNELLGVMSDIIRKEISAEIQEAGFYSIMADESKDVSKKEQLSIVLRYVLKGNAYERFLGFTAAEGLDAASLFSYIRNAITEHGLSLKQCVGQCYDGAAVMSGRCSGVQKKIKEEAPTAVYMHCYAHRLNLVLVDAVKHCSAAENFFCTLGVPVYFCVYFQSAHYIYEDIGRVKSWAATQSAKTT